MRKKMADARAPEEIQAARAEYAVRLLAFAERHPDREAFAALIRCVQLSGGHIVKDSPAARAVAALEKSHVKHRDMIAHAAFLGKIPDEGCARLLRAVLEQHPDRRTRAKACHALARARRHLAEEGEALTPGTLRNLLHGRNLYLHYVAMGHERGSDGEAQVKHLKANAKKYRAEATAMNKLLQKSYPDVFPDLSIGKKAPEVLSQDLDGKPVKLSDLRGQVVVLDVWATWCGPCKAMIPHQRGLVKRLEGKPFALVSISVDDNKEKVSAFLKKTPMPWTHWWNGPRQGLVVDWDVTSYPTIYVLDHKGVIRYKGVRDRQMDAAVDRLLKEKEDEGRKVLAP
jgi:thiol-disulfide isomerase/thioredoxin